MAMTRQDPLLLRVVFAVPFFLILLRAPPPTTVNAFPAPLHTGTVHSKCRVPMKSTHLHLSSNGQELSTIRVPLQRIYNGEREYLFTTRRNIREYEWGISEVEELFESILDLREPSGGDALELNAITIMPAGLDPEANIGKASQVYDVHDGQQRLVTLCLIFAALRDNFLEWEKHGSDLEDVAKEIAKAIYPTKPLLDPVARIQMKGRKHSVMHSILSNKDEEGKDFYSTFGKRFTIKERKNLPQSELLILEAYEYLKERIKDIGSLRALQFLEDLTGNTHLLVCIPATTRMARSIVMGLGKGKNLEPVDEFKGLVCFNSIQDEHVQDQTLEKWNALCEKFGRDLVASSCLLTAQIFMQKTVSRNGEVDYFEDYLKRCLESSDICDGAAFFERRLVPTASRLQNFHDGLTTLSGKGNKPFPSLSFLRAATQIQTSKDAEMVILNFLNELDQCNNEHDRSSVEDDLFDLEGIALWMMLTKPKPALRRKRCFDIISMRNKGSAVKRGEQFYNPLVLSADEKRAIHERLNSGEFGKGVDSKIGKAILERLNEHELVTSSQVQKIQYVQSTLQIEHILPQKYTGVGDWTSVWEVDDADSWMHRLGNLVLLNQKINSKISNGPFSKKREHYRSSPYPMTRRISEHFTDRWTAKEAEENHAFVVNLANSVWELSSR